MLLENKVITWKLKSQTHKTKIGEFTNKTR